MKILKTVQRHYVALGISSTPRLSERVLAGFLLYLCVIVLQLMYTFHMAGDFMESVEYVCSISGTIVGFVFFAAIVFNRILLFESIANIEQLIDTRRKYAKSEALFFETSQQVERLSEIVFTVLMKVAVPCFILPKCIVIFVVYFTTDLESDLFQLPYPLWFPFDWNNPIGYLFASLLEYIILDYEYLINACTLALCIGAFWFAISATKELKCILHSINCNAKNGQSKELKVLFAEFNDVHAATKQIERNFSDILQPMSMALFTWSLLAISGVMLIFQMEILHHENIIPVLLNTTVNGVLGLIVVFIACDLGQRMNDAFEGINSTIDQFDWYLFPIEIKQMLPMIIANAQQPVELKCFGSIACTREVFRKILHCAYSYFTVLSQLGA